MTDASRTLVTSPDGQWTAAREDRTLVLFQGLGTRLGTIELPSDDVDMALVGPPAALLVTKLENS